MNMKTTSKALLLALAFTMGTGYASAQEILTGFHRETSSKPMRYVNETGIFLPFMDDFSQSRLIPDSTKWADRNAMVNDGFPLNPPTRNAATLDVLDQYGRVYDYAISNPFVAEYLTSARIRLDSIMEPEPRALTPADSVYFSFWYQPQGNGNPPEAQDSLVLQFGIVVESDTVWTHVWSTPGQKLGEFVAENNGLYFRQVMIPIRDVKFFTSHFFFRFYNYASIVSSSLPSNRGNEDIWNIDLVYLNVDRTVSDTSLPKLAFSGQRPGFLKRYQSMPYRQYRANPNSAIRENLRLDIANLDHVAHEAHYYYTVRQINGNQHYTRFVDPVVVNPYLEAGYLDCPEYGESPACPYVGELFELNMWQDSASYEIKHYVYDSTCTPPLVDSMVYRQGFYNYFAYDDGTPEMGYGVEPANGCFAVRFEMADFDTIQGVQLLFNHTLNDANNKYFDIAVWKDENGRPGDEIYRMTGQRPQWSDMPFEFHYYRFPQPVMLSGIFYIGLVQQNNGLINIGFDASFDNSQHNFYNVNGSWQESEMRGSLMIRPVVGPSYYIGVNESCHATQNVELYPNPASNTLNIKISDNSDIVKICIYDLTGHKLFQSAFEPTVPVESLMDGLYLISLTTADGQVITQKFTIKK